MRRRTSVFKSYLDRSNLTLATLSEARGDTELLVDTDAVDAGLMLYMVGSWIDSRDKAGTERY